MELPQSVLITLSLESVEAHTNNWMTSEWFGNFYSMGSPWIFSCKTRLAVCAT